MLKTAALILAAYILVAWNDAHAAGDYYKLTPDIDVSAATRGDELFAEMVTLMPPTDIVGGPRSIAVKIYGSCSMRVYTMQGIAMFSGKWRGGHIVDTVEGDNVIRRVLPKSNMAKLFDKECAK